MGRARSTSEKQAYPDWLDEAEGVALERRRGRLTSPLPPECPRVGLALSGGGIRSATFSLGVLQSLARSGVLPKIDYLSTVSGGGYIGSFLGGLYARGATSDAKVIEALTRFPESDQLHWLRSNGRFLAPNGASASWLAGAVLLRNWISLLVVLAPAAFFLSFLGALVRTGLARALARNARLFEGYGWPLEVAGLQLSPWFVVPVACAVYWMLPCGVAYWMVNAGHRSSRSPVASAAAVATVLGAPLSFVYLAHKAGEPLLPFAWVSGLVFATCAAFLGACALRTHRQSKRHDAKQHAGFNPFGPDHDSIARNKLSEWMKGGLVAVVVFSLVTAVDTLGFEAFRAMLSEEAMSTAFRQLAALASGVGAVVLGTHRILALLGPKKTSGGGQIPVQLLLPLLAGGLLLLGAISIFAATYWLSVPAPRQISQPAPGAAALGVVVSFVVMLGLSRFVVFVNQSSLGSIYAARLTRAYLGASNSNRWSRESAFKGKESPIEPIPGDQIEWHAYKPHESGGPIHLINVTVNETVDPRVQLHEPDRRGMVMAVGPVGVSLGVRHHAAWDGSSPRPDSNTFHVFPKGDELKGAEKLPVGQWVAVSGAAVATGLGQLSIRGASLLCGIFNMRLGYWWQSNVSPGRRHHQARAVSLGGSLMNVFGHLFPVYRLLAAEFLNRFPGTAFESWYLTDGGHLENTACYELIRRRVPFIICVDNGADPSSSCSDLANLVRLARVDFGAEVEFLDSAQLEALLDPAVAPYFGALQDLKREVPRKKAYAGLARVTYAEGAVSWIVFIKPTLLGTEPVDIGAYGLDNPSFPQQSTGDQSFDDAQWEAYRKLGDHIGSKLFDIRSPKAEDRWWPNWLEQDALDLLTRNCPPPDSELRRKTGVAAGVSESPAAPAEKLAPERPGS